MFTSSRRDVTETPPLKNPAYATVSLSKMLKRARNQIDGISANSHPVLSKSATKSASPHLRTQKKNVADYCIKGCGLAIVNLLSRRAVSLCDSTSPMTEQKHFQITSFCWLQNSVASHVCIAAYACSNPATMKQGHLRSELHITRNL